MQEIFKKKKKVEEKDQQLRLNFICGKSRKKLHILLHQMSYSVQV